MKRPRSSSKRPAPAPPEERGALIALDTRKIRDEALLAFRKTEGELAKLQSQIQRYEERDLPGFSAWCHRTFGNLFVQLRRLQAALQEKQTIARAISDLAFRLDLTELDAYREYLWRRENPEQAEADDRRRDEEARLRLEKEEASPGKAHKKAEKPDEEWDEMHDFFASMAGLKPRRPKKPEADPKTARELYRAIVRMLHPDHHGKMSEAVKHLWDVAQAAWRNRDVKTLRNVLDQCETHEVGVGNQTAVSVILQMTKRLTEATRRLRSQIRHLSRKLEWNYEARKNNPVFVRKVQTVILDDIRLVRFQHDRLARALDALEVADAKKKTPRKRKAARL
ncbi:MAG: hypothetical protein R6X19_09590 [Kiritimatiellia bacterium]